MSLLAPPKVEIYWPPEGIEVLWRAEPQRYSYVIDADLEIYGVTDPVVRLNWYEVKHWTPGGHARLVNGKLCYFGREVTMRRWACKTPEEALDALAERRKRQIRILQGKLRDAETELILARNAEIPPREARAEA